MRVSGRVLLSVLLLVTSVTSILQSQNASAAQITARSLELQSGAGGDGGSKPSGIVNHKFNLTIPNAGSGNIGSIKFEYCTTASGTCTAPTGLSNAITPVSLSGTQTGGETFTSAVNPSANVSYITRTAEPFTAGASVSYILVGMRNPSTQNTSFYVRVTTHVATNATGATIDDGVVAASTTNTNVIQVTGTMPESLIFCTGATIGMDGTIPDCTDTTAGTVAFDKLFSPIDTAAATSQMAASTNAGTGYVITVSGSKLTTGSVDIEDAGATAISVVGNRGQSKFGLNLVANTTAASTPAVGAAIDPASNVGAKLRGQATTDFGTADSYAYVSTGSTIARSDYTTGGPFPTNGQRYTVSYFANVSGSQTAGNYTATLTYVCTATF